METKICKKCGQELPISEFRKTRWGTLAETCNKCFSEAMSKTKAINRVNEKQEARSLRLQDFEPRELMEELKRRGYKGELTFVQHIKL